MHIFGIPRVHRVLLCIWFPWTPPVLTLTDVKGLREVVTLSGEICSRITQHSEDQPSSSKKALGSESPLVRARIGGTLVRLVRRTPNETCSIRKVSCETMAWRRNRWGREENGGKDGGNRMKWREIRQIKRRPDCCICYIGGDHDDLLLRAARKWKIEERCKLQGKRKETSSKRTARNVLTSRPPGLHLVMLVKASRPCAASSVRALHVLSRRGHSFRDASLISKQFINLPLCQGSTVIKYRVIHM